MARSKALFKRGDVVSYRGVPMYVADVNEMEGGRKLHLQHIDDQGRLGTSKVLYEGLYGDELQLIDFTRVEVRVHLPEEWQKLTIPSVDPTGETEIKGDMPEAHPGYGVATITRVSGQSKLFMSPMQHHHWISLRFSRAKLYRNLSEDRAHAERELIEVHFSEAQWGRFLSSISMGDGVPCTLSRVAGKMMPAIPERDERSIFHQEIEEYAKAANEGVRELESYVDSLLEKPTVTKTERKSLQERVQALKRRIGDSMPFVVKQFDERMEDIVSDAKTEVESFMALAVQRIGLSQMALQEAPKLALPALTSPTTEST